MAQAYTTRTLDCLRRNRSRCTCRAILKPAQPCGQGCWCTAGLQQSTFLPRAMSCSITPTPAWPSNFKSYLAKSAGKSGNSGRGQVCGDKATPCEGSAQNATLASPRHLDDTRHEHLAWDIGVELLFEFIPVLHRDEHGLRACAWVSNEAPKVACRRAHRRDALTLFHLIWRARRGTNRSHYVPCSFFGGLWAQRDEITGIVGGW